MLKCGGFHGVGGGERSLPQRIDLEGEDEAGRIPHRAGARWQGAQDIVMDLLPDVFRCIALLQQTGGTFFFFFANR